MCFLCVRNNHGKGHEITGIREKNKRFFEKADV